ncbi:hypothetical protein WR25_08406 [Diploscapter pachys]|uniref:Uncharacterized protein n=1 Tax=Diploscapter pachys TaxID=2018661 RepID=A0A2A2KTP3_9BILA|nr:hypothetical protein WR25_08406 [Diploscapter pachys]
MEKSLEKKGEEIVVNENIFIEPVDFNLVDLGESLLPHHPFDNACRFPIVATYPEDLSSYRVGERLRTLKCPIEEYPLATQDSEGYLYIHNHFEHYGNTTADVKCKVIILEGGLRDPKTNKGKDKIEHVKVYEGIENKRLWVNADNYLVKCTRQGKVTWEKPFAGMRDDSKERNVMFVAKDVSGLDSFGMRIREKPKKTPERYSIDILGFDSTARNMFVRHMPRTVDTMNKLGYHFLYGYNKVGDNSVINLGPLLAGDMKEALEAPMNDTSGDLNADWLFPLHSKLDPSAVPFLWKLMKEKFGCKTMFNDDPSVKQRGLFHYPRYEFLPGFSEMPADHYYRPYYVTLFEKWLYGPCKDGDQIQKDFVDLWYRFAQRYQDVCHFGFTFITTLTHEAGLTIELIDEYLAGRLSQLHLTGALDNSLSIIMGDHGNRIGIQQFSYTGRIEERMPLMAIRLPTNFAEKYPNEYANFLKNKFKLTRTCRDALVPYNFCTCMLDRSNDTNRNPNVSPPEEHVPYNPKMDNVEPQNVEGRSYEAIKTWLEKSELNQCISPESIKINKTIYTLSLNPFARHGFRTLTNLTRNEGITKLPHKLDYYYHEMSVSATAVTGTPLELLFRIEEEVKRKLFNVVFEPFVLLAPRICYRPSIIETCSCMLNNFQKPKTAFVKT